jgi:hypothetical protein
MNINMGRITFYFRAKNKYKIHSPLLYSFTNEVVEDQDVYYADIDIKKLHELILANHPGWKRSILNQDIYSTLFRINKWFQPQLINIKGDKDGGLSALALHYGARNSKISIQTENPEMEEWIRKHFKLFNIADTPIQFLKEGDNFKSSLEKKALNLLDSSQIKSTELRNYHEVLSKSSSGNCLILTHLSKSKDIRKSWMELTKSGKRGCFYIDLYHIGVIIYTGNDQAPVYQAIVSFRKKWFQVY